jgi:hypothetical protein
MSEKVTLTMNGHDGHSEAAGRRSSFPERSFALLRMTAPVKLAVAAVRDDLSLSVT